jgi:multisubunit Na+/H+ antiporter MnhB subunit
VNRRSLILSACVRAEFHTLLLISLYLLFAGHNQPGGGFAGGLVAACALALRFAADGPEGLRRTAPVEPFVLLGAGLLLALVTAIVPLTLGGSLLDSASVELDLVALGHTKISSVLAFDTGVYLVVLGAALLLLEQFGGAEPEPVPATDAVASSTDEEPRR